MYDMTPDAMDQDTMTLSERQTAAIEAVADQITRLNAAVRESVDSGMSVELQRSERYHCGGGCWGDMMKPVIVKCV
ncbi:hypothetical protein [Rubellimicrobium aerolatum]|uniref:Uncharacterized protein n=1 Tax=Rubellimicrobium aerolatum TaxID=490979 RepID=A0ABW0SAR2_9RHOB|nr:hypothetical protein [Rubellimicrobium aerolatum]MBP1806119.1 hypothetical protein [Rubellimicrobium aerolatum]